SAVAERDSAVAERDSAVALASLMKQSWSWRLTRPLRFAARLARYGLTNDDRLRITQSLRYRYHRLPLPVSVKKMASFAYHKVVGKFIKALRRSALSVSQFSAPQIKSIPKEDSTPDYIVWGVIDWHFRHQRPQQLAVALANTCRRVLYISPNFLENEQPGFDVEVLDASSLLFQIRLFVKNAPVIYSSAPGLEDVSQLRASIGEVLAWAGCKQIVSLVDHPFWLDVAAALPNSRLVYDCMDHHEGFGNNAESLMQLEKKLLSEAELTITTSTWLDEAIAPHAKRRALIRNAGEYEHFAKVPESIYRDPQGRRIIGYYGAIAEWFDLDLVEAVAKQHPDCSMLLIGADTVNARARLAKLPNVTFTGEVPYSRLPHYLYGFDVCLLPFKVIPLTLATNPVKAYEYLGAGKPIVAVDLPEMAQFDGLMYAAAGKDAFLAAVSKVLSQPEPDSLVQQRKAFAQGQTWQHRAEALIQAAESSAHDPKISIVVVTYNNLDFTCACLASLDEHSQYEHMEIIVVDNASSDGSPAFLSEWVANGQNRKLILNDDNRGFAAANNQGLAVATGEYLVLLNNDTYVTPGWLRTLIRHLKHDKSIGLIGPVTNNIGNEAKIDIRYADMGEMLVKSAAFTRRHVGQTYPLRTAAFFCVMMPRTSLEAVGALDEAFGRGFFEDDDYCRRIEQQGMRVVCAEDVFIHHHLSASFNKLKQQDRQQLFEDNKKIYEAKWGEWVPHGYRGMKPGKST
ncbi:MAG: glycosyltransferase, partial [Xanthomonadaceae bacterium]|nr:glycosyltransferase [Xanthomonadaceae bacterium]